MDARAVMREIVERSGRSQAQISAELGRSPSYVSATLARPSDLHASTLAAVADVCGVEIVARDRESGEIVATIDPPARS